MAFILPPLPYAYDALEPHIDAETMKIHHGRHHDAYVANLNKAVTGTEAEGLALEEILAKVSKFPAAIRNNAGGHFNHSLFWTSMAPGIETAPSGKLASAINAIWGSPEEFKQKFTAEAAGGGGWGWASPIKKKKSKIQKCKL
jgi:Fe-Mn family superoxide dismutase